MREEEDQEKNFGSETNIGEVLKCGARGRVGGGWCKVFQDVPARVSSRRQCVESAVVFGSNTPWPQVDCRSPPVRVVRRLVNHMLYRAQSGVVVRGREGRGRG